jgi:phage-related protein
MDLELEPEVEEWLDGLAVGEFGTGAFHLDRLAERGAQLRMPHSRALGDGLFELRYDLSRVAQRITFFFAGGERIVLLTVFGKQRMNEAQEIKRARQAMKRCVHEQHTTEDD